MATRPTLRAHRRLPPIVVRDAHRRILELLVAHPDGMRQEELMAHVGLARSSISALLGELTDLVQDSETTVQIAGRPPRLHRIRADRGVVASIDVGMSRVHVMLCDLAGVPLTDEDPREHRMAQTRARGIAERTLEAAVELIRTMLAEHGRDENELAAIGVSLPGTVARDARTTSDPALPRWHDVDVPAFLVERLHGGAIVVVEQEANAAMLAERRWGHARRIDDAIFVEWSATISASAMIGGRVWRGATGTAADLGHLQLPLDASARRALGVTGRAALVDAACPHCGQALCVQQLVGGLRMGEVLNVTTIHDGVVVINEDPRALERVRAMAHLLGRAIGVGVSIIDPACVIVGGGAPKHLLQLGFDDIKRGAFATAAPREPRIELSDLGPTAAVRGAASAAVDAGTVRYLLALVS